jgi:hypothetical protein
MQRTLFGIFFHDEHRSRCARIPDDGTEPPVQPTPLARAGAGREFGRLVSRDGRSDLSRLPAGRLTGNVGWGAGERSFRSRKRWTIRFGTIASSEPMGSPRMNGGANSPVRRVAFRKQSVIRNYDHAGDGSLFRTPRSP